MEGPSLVICKEETAFLKGKKILRVSGNAAIDFNQLENKRVKAIRSFGKHLLIQLHSITIRVHFLMFGSYRVNERRERAPRLCLEFEKDELNFYSCAIKVVEGDLDEVYDWTADVMSPRWDPAKARRKLKKLPGMNVGDALLDQTIFAGVGNIIKNEVLYRLMVHPESVIGSLPPRKLTALVNEARNYSFDFYEWKKSFVLRKHWEVYKKKKCKRCDVPVMLEHTGDNPRRSFYCPNCQILYK